MPRLRIPGVAEKVPVVCILKMGRHNIIQWRDEIYSQLTAEYNSADYFLSLTRDTSINHHNKGITIPSGLKPFNWAVHV